MSARKKADDGLWVVMDRDGDQWLCPSRPSLLRGTWFMDVDSDIKIIWTSTGCVRLGKHDVLDASCFEGRNRWKAYRVTVSLA